MERNDDRLLFLEELAEYLDIPTVVTSLESLEFLPGHQEEHYLVRDILHDVARKVMVSIVEVLERTEEGSHMHVFGQSLFEWVRGTGRVIVAGSEIEMSPGVRVLIPRGVAHDVVAEAGSLFLSVQNPPIRNPETGQVDYVKEV